MRACLYAVINLLLIIWLACPSNSFNETEVLSRLKSLENRMQDTKNDMDNGWLLTNSYLVFFMGVGFALLEAGSVRIKNVSSILLKNLMNASICTIGFVSLGYGLAFGKSGNPLFSYSEFFLVPSGDEVFPFAYCMFQWSFNVCTSTIVSGSVAERMSISGYLCYNFAMSSLIYPLVAHAFWSNQGWLSPFSDSGFSKELNVIGFMDFAGGAVVHMTGGLCGLIGAIAVGPRKGRFLPDGTVNRIFGHSQTLAVLGGFILAFGWFSFNSGSTLALSENESQISGLAAMNTAIASAVAGLTILFVHFVQSGAYDLTEGLNGVLAGCVGITPCCGFVSTWAAVPIGFFASIVYFLSSRLLVKLRIDDPLAASPIHFFVGLFGILAVGLFSEKDLVITNYTEDRINSIFGGKDNVSYGLLLGGGWGQIFIQALGGVVVIVFVSLASIFMFLFLKLCTGIRVSKETEEIGLDTMLLKQ